MAGLMYDEQFKTYLALSKDLIADLKSSEDKKICSKWVSKLCSMQSDDISVKQNRNGFFRYLISIMNEGVLDEAIMSDPNASGLPAFEDSGNHISPGQELRWLRDQVFEPNAPTNFISHWSADRKTYVAAKPIPGRGALIYMASCSDPSLGWDLPGKIKPASG